ncbi:hypothetical protein BV22DRAFT_47358 [Leucogyrophana mollusca]|uniref:Uncharacterized protein n=1 Tax=Leucogyrophana mollusca TaxID=85980 RepID=A0ACB8BZH6_9AGAM|nr:hypothetical protein BV22DRAFT_47358 [Leucogyrophana mollusca]
MTCSVSMTSHLLQCIGASLVSVVSSRPSHGCNRGANTTNKRQPTKSSRHACGYPRVACLLADRTIGSWRDRTQKLKKSCIKCDVGDFLITGTTRGLLCRSTRRTGMRSLTWFVIVFVYHVVDKCGKYAGCQLLGSYSTGRCDICAAVRTRHCNTLVRTPKVAFCMGKATYHSLFTNVLVFPCSSLQTSPTRPRAVWEPPPKW